MIGIVSFDKWATEEKDLDDIAKEISALNAKINVATNNGQQVRKLLYQKTVLEKKLGARSKAYF